MSLNESKIDYLAESGKLINRPGRSLNLITGCLHWKGDDPICSVPCYARRMVEHGRLKGNKAYPYGFEPTFHPERIKHYALRDKRPMLLFLNDMGDVGGDWNWKDINGRFRFAPGNIAKLIRHFAQINPEHIILLLTKNPAWYGLIDSWPDNCWCGFTATNNEEFGQRWYDIKQTGVLRKRMWLSAEPWYDPEPPDFMYIGKGDWVVLGSQTRPDKPVSEAVKKWLDWIERPHEKPRPDFKIFVKDNSQWFGILREYPDEFRYKQKGANDDESNLHQDQRIAGRRTSCCHARIRRRS